MSTNFDFNASFGDLAREFSKGAKEFARAMAEEAEARGYGERCREFTDGLGSGSFDLNLDFQDAGYPRHQTYKLEDGSLVYRFLLPGFDEKGIDLSFKGDLMILKARLAEDFRGPAGGEGRGPFGEGRGLFGDAFKRPFARDVERREYKVPAEQYDQASAKASYKNGVLTVTIPPKEEDMSYAIKVEIKKDGE